MKERKIKKILSIPALDLYKTEHFFGEELIYFVERKWP
jgi:hypothetical protein